MKCPVCRSEVGNQQVCPYCGGTVFLQEPSWNPAGMVTGPLFRGPQEPLPPEILNRISAIETKLNLLLVLQGATFLLLAVALIALALGA